MAALFAHEIDLLVTPDPLPRPGVRFVPVFDYEQVLVVGAGPAGLEAGLMLARRGHDVTIVTGNIGDAAEVADALSKAVMVVVPLTARYSAFAAPMLQVAAEAMVEPACTSRMSASAWRIASPCCAARRAWFTSISVST